jgi:hypothetical protein
MMEIVIVLSVGARRVNKKGREDMGTLGVGEQAFAFCCLNLTNEDCFACVSHWFLGLFFSLISKVVAHR